ncbi:MAG: hypothetical protein ABJE95_28400 [Byssovorax sp.]
MNTKRPGGLGGAATAVKACVSMAPHGVALLCALSLVGCLAQTGDETDGDVGVTQEAALTNNALTNNALTNNALTNNALTNNALTNNALTNNALTNNALTNNALTDPNAREVLKYIASCALPATSTLNLTIAGVDYSFPGSLGLAPTWEQSGGTCNTTCQEWVSACVLARLDYLGQHVDISLRGHTPALAASASEKSAYPVAEGAYFGNIFLATPVRYACIAPGQTGLTRVCGPSTVGCAVEVLGSCATECDKADKANGFFPNCSNENTAAAQGNAGFQVRKYAASATVFLLP